jgi:four helix bundle protein
MVMGEAKKAGGYKDLIVWQKAIALVKRVYQVTSTFPSDERFGLVSQVRRAAVSVASNIAEGQARHTTGEFIHGISHAEGSLAELDTQLTIIVELEYSPPTATTDVFALLGEVRKTLNVLRRTLEARA